MIGPDSLSQKSGFLVTSLEPELSLPYSDLYFLVVLHSLFARRIVLPDSHALDNSQFRRFFSENCGLLNEERFDDRASPMFAVMGKRGRELWESIDLWLRPKGERRRPTYLTSLSPRQNRQLAEDYDQLSEKERRDRLLKVTSPQYHAHVDRLMTYLRRHDNCVIPTAPETTFYGFVSRQLDGLKTASLPSADACIVDSITRRIEEADASEGYQSRERLHEAIYGGLQPPRIWEGKPYPGNPPMRNLPTRHAWRLFIDALQNSYHAAISSSPAVLSPHFRIPKALGDISWERVRRPMSERVTVHLGTKVYAEHLDLKFAVTLRREDAFWDSIAALEAHPGAPSLLADHIQIVSDGFARYLVEEKGLKRLVRRSKAEIVTENVDSYAASGWLVAVCLACLLYSDPGEVGFAVGAIFGVRETARASIRKLFGDQETVNPKFKSFVADVCNRARKEAGAIP